MRNVRATWLLGALLAAAVGAGPCASEESGATAIDPAELAQRIESGSPPLVLDVRSAREFESGHIPGAVNIPHGELGDRLAELPASSDTEIVVHCESGRRASAAESILREAGYSNVRDLRGHMKAWRSGGRPVE